MLSIIRLLPLVAVPALANEMLGRRRRSSTYRAAVIEYAPTQASDLDTLDVATANVIKMSNLDGLEVFAKEAVANGSQVVVFPEYGITGDGAPGCFLNLGCNFNRQTVQPFLEELPANITNPCDEATDLPLAPGIVRTSCMARELNVLLVLNLNTRELCSANHHKCPSDGMKVHNTALAFNEDGTILARYNKRHPYGDEMAFIDKGGDEMKGGVTFTSSFGVKFGMFICFDLLFYLDGGNDAHEILYPTDWVNDPLGPIPEPVSARNAQRTWSLVHGKNVLAANYGGFAKESSGSGIWHKGHALASYYNPSKEPKSKLLIADVPIISSSTVV